MDELQNGLEAARLAASQAFPDAVVTIPPTLAAPAVTAHPSIAGTVPAASTVVAPTPPVIATASVATSAKGKAKAGVLLKMSPTKLLLHKSHASKKATKVFASIHSKQSKKSAVAAPAAAPAAAPVLKKDP